MLLLLLLLLPLLLLLLMKGEKDAFKLSLTYGFEPKSFFMKNKTRVLRSVQCSDHPKRVGRSHIRVKGGRSAYALGMVLC